MAVSALLLVVLAIRRPVAHLFGANWAYTLWLLPALRLVLPPLPKFIEDTPLTVMIAVGEATAPLPVSAGPGQWVPVLLALWAGGAVVFFLWQLATYRLFLRRIANGARAACSPFFEGVATLASAAVDGPVAVGLLDRRIVVPIDFAERYSAVERRLALRHERIHHRRGDIWWNMAALLILALNWFNPLAFIAFRAFRADQELACDAVVAAGSAASERHDYAAALVKSASRPGLIAACPLHHADQLKRRLKMMKQHRSSTARTLGGATIMMALAAGIVLFAGPGYAQQEEKKEVVKKEIRIRQAGPDGRVVVRTDAERAELRAKCAADKGSMESDVTVGDGDDKRVTRIMICGKGAPTAEVRQKLLAALEEAKADLGSESELKPDRRADIVAALQKEIERVRALPLD